jgi:hypothetical protein
MSGIVVFNPKIFLSISVVFGGPYPGFTTPALPGETDKDLLVATHLKVFQEQVSFVSYPGNTYSRRPRKSPNLWLSHQVLNQFLGQILLKLAGSV